MERIQSKPLSLGLYGLAAASLATAVIVGLTGHVSALATAAFAATPLFLAGGYLMTPLDPKRITEGEPDRPQVLSEEDRLWLQGTDDEPDGGAVGELRQALNEVLVDDYLGRHDLALELWKATEDQLIPYELGMHIITPFAPEQKIDDNKIGQRRQALTDEGITPETFKDEGQQQMAQEFVFSRR